MIKSMDNEEKVLYHFNSNGEIEVFSIKYWIIFWYKDERTITHNETKISTKHTTL